MPPSLPQHRRKSQGQRHGGPCLWFLWRMAEQSLRTANASAVRHFGKRLQVFGSDSTSTSAGGPGVDTPPRSVSANRPDTLRDRFAAFLWESAPVPASADKSKPLQEPKSTRNRSVIPSPSPVMPSTHGGDTIVSATKRSPSQSPPSLQKTSPPGQYGISSPTIHQKSPPEPLVFNFKGYDGPSPLASPPSTTRQTSSGAPRPLASPPYDAPSGSTRIAKSSSGGIAIRASTELRSEFTSTAMQSASRNPHPMFMEAALAQRPVSARQGASRDVSFLAERRPSSTRSVSRTLSASPGQTARSLSQARVDPHVDSEEPSNVGSLDVPPTRIPEQFHILQTSDKVPSDDSGVHVLPTGNCLCTLPVPSMCLRVLCVFQPLWQRLSDTKWVRQVFPEFHPTGRHQALVCARLTVSLLPWRFP
jgi:hypothetical protein